MPVYISMKPAHARSGNTVKPLKNKKVDITHDSILTASQFGVITSWYIVQAIQSLYLDFSETNSETPNWTTSSTAPYSISSNQVPCRLYLSGCTCPYSQCGISCRQMKICCLHFRFLWLTAKGMNWYLHCSENKNDLFMRMLCSRNSVDNGHHKEISHVLKITPTHSSMLYKYKSNLGRNLYWELRIAV